MQILRQLGELFLESIPTVILFLLFYWFLRATFFKPLQSVLDERNARINKARADAEAIVAAAKEKSDTYQEALRKARAGVFAEQESVRQAALEERARLLRAARHAEQEVVRKEKERIAREFETTRAQLESQSDLMAARIVQMILEGSHGPRREAQ
jgi:F-type H+-transporting ATPase subunit b